MILSSLETISLKRQQSSSCSFRRQRYKKIPGYHSKHRLKPGNMLITLFTLLLFYPFTFQYILLSAQSPLSRFLYPIASLMCCTCTRSDPSRSAMVRATFSMRL